MSEKYNRDKCFNYPSDKYANNNINIHGHFLKKIFEYDLVGKEGRRCIKSCKLKSIYKYAETCLSINFALSNTITIMRIFKNICFNILIKKIEEDNFIDIAMDKPDTKSLESEIADYQNKVNISYYLDEIKRKRKEYNDDLFKLNFMMFRKEQDEKKTDLTNFNEWKNSKKIYRHDIANIYIELLSYIKNDVCKKSLYYLFSLVRLNKITSIPGSIIFPGQSDIYKEINDINPRGTKDNIVKENYYGLIPTKFGSPQTSWERSNCVLNKTQNKDKQTKLYKYFYREGIPTSCGISGHILMFLTTYMKYSRDTQFTFLKLKIYIMFCFSFLCLTGGHSLAECISTLKIIYLYYKNNNILPYEYSNKFNVLEKVVENIFVFDEKINISKNNTEDKYIQYEKLNNRRLGVVYYNPKQNMYNFFKDILPKSVSNLTEAMINDYIYTICP